MAARNNHGKFVKQSTVGQASASPNYVDATTTTSSVTFSYPEALMLIKKGFHMARSGWNGKGMRVFYVNSAPIDVPTTLPKFANTFMDPYIALYTAQGSVVPWTCSNNDMAANDWTMVALPVGMSL